MCCTFSSRRFSDSGLAMARPSRGVVSCGVSCARAAGRAEGRSRGGGAGEEVLGRGERAGGKGREGKGTRGSAAQAFFPMCKREALRPLPCEPLIAEAVIPMELTSTISACKVVASLFPVLYLDVLKIGPWFFVESSWLFKNNAHSYRHPVVTILSRCKLQCTSTDQLIN